jgi:hypothetical protein
MNLGKIARITGLKEELRNKRKELEGLVVEYIEISRDPKKPVPWRRLARCIGMDHTQLFKIAKRKGLVAGKEQESAAASIDCQGPKELTRRQS